MSYHVQYMGIFSSDFVTTVAVQLLNFYVETGQGSG